MLFRNYFFDWLLQNYIFDRLSQNCLIDFLVFHIYLFIFKKYFLTLEVQNWIEILNIWSFTASPARLINLCHLHCLGTSQLKGTKWVYSYIPWTTLDILDMEYELVHGWPNTWKMMFVIYGPPLSQDFQILLRKKGKTILHGCQCQKKEKCNKLNRTGERTKKTYSLKYFCCSTSDHCNF